MRLKNQGNMHRILNFVSKNCDGSLHSEIINRICDDCFPPYEFWLGIGHSNCWQFERVVARGIARWIEQQEHYIQDHILGLLNNDFCDDGDANSDELFAYVCKTVWYLMLPQEWLIRHAVDTSPKSQLWGRALLHVHYAIIHDEWQHLRNHRADFFLEG